MKKQFLLGLMAMVLPLASWAQATFNVTVSPKTDKTLVYAGDETKNNVEVKVTVQFAGEEEAETLQENTDFEVVSYKNSTTNEDFLRNAGTYQVTIKGLEAYRGYTIPAGTFEITKKELTDLTFSAGEKEYGATLADANLTDAIKITEENGLLTNQTEQEAELKNALSCLTLNFVNGPEKVGENNIVTVKGLEGDNNPSNYYYKGEGAPIYLKITPKVLTATLATMSSEYTGQEIALGSLTPTINSEDIVGEDVVTVEFKSVKDGKTIKNVDNYTLVAELDGEDAGNYTLANGGEIGYEITRATLEITVNEENRPTKPYDGKDVRNVTEHYTIKTNTTETITDLHLTMVKDEGADVGDYPVNVCINGTAIKAANYDAPGKLQNYKVSYKKDELPYTITPKTVKYYFTSNGQKYNGVAITKETLTEGTDYEVEIDPSNDFVEGETWPEGTTKPTAKFNYEGEIRNVYDYPLTTDQAAGEATNYEFVALTGTTIGEGENEKKINVYPITKAALTIIIKDQKLNFGELTAENEAATLAKWMTYNAGVVTFKNYGNGDGPALRSLFKLTLTHNDAENGAKIGDSGEYTIGVEWIADNELSEANKLIKGNYTFDDDVTGTLTIGGEKSLELNGEEDLTETIKAKNGATVETVTVKNLKNYAGYVDEENGNTYGDDADATVFKAEQWYTLVLPFEIEVRELSKQLGYAIVNVPDYDNTKYDAQNKRITVNYKLEMQKVPANTLMAFKVDKTTELTAEEGLTFTGVKIEAPVENINAEGAEFVPVYEEATFDEENELAETAWFLWPAKGTFYRMGAVLEDMTEPSFTVYPLNGYIRTTIEGAEARIFMQEADGSTTEISAITGKAINSNAAEGWYTVGGMKLNAQPTQKGVYINNGKKVVIK